jgi:signal transduction histidine kinase
MLDKTADRGTEIMQELLVFGQKADARLVSIDVREQIGRTMEMLKTGLPSNVNLVVQLEDELPPIYADPGQLDWILANLVVNAKDAMPDGGTITITGKMIQFAPESARSLPIDMPMHKASYLCLTVSDTGVGMEESTLQKAFEPFFTTKPLGKGTGLGLSVVFGLMESHNGFIDIQSKPGQGAAISLFFPLPQPQKPEPKDELSAALA